MTRRLRPSRRALAEFAVFITIGLAAAVVHLITR